jgi:ketosteroid isomerase-like protein
MLRSRSVATDAVSTVHAWHEALNRGDVDELIALSGNKIEVGGPRGRGTGPGAQLLQEWFERAGIRLVPYRTFHRDNVVVVEQGASWQSPDAGSTTAPQTVASVFIVKDGRVASVVRHPDLASAFEASGLAYSDKV